MTLQWRSEVIRGRVVEDVLTDAEVAVGGRFEQFVFATRRFAGDFKNAVRWAAVHPGLVHPPHRWVAVKGDKNVRHDIPCRGALVIVQQQIAGDVDVLITITVFQNPFDLPHPPLMQIGLAHRSPIGLRVHIFGRGKRPARRGHRRKFSRRNDSAHGVDYTDRCQAGLNQVVKSMTTFPRCCWLCK